MAWRRRQKPDFLPSLFKEVILGVLLFLSSPLQLEAEVRSGDRWLTVVIYQEHCQGESK